MIKRMYFENEQGRVEMFLGGAGPVRVTALSGFGNPVRTYNAVNFAGKDGQKTLSSVAETRTMIVCGDIRYKNREFLEKVMRIFDGEGTLYLDFDGKKRKIKCNQVKFEDGERNGSYMKFILTLIADGVYFNDVYPTEIAVFEKRKMLEGDIVFPCVFTEKTTQAWVENFGEVSVEPVITIYNFYDSENESENGIVIENLTTGQKFELSGGMTENETITIDIPARRVTSSVRGNIVSLISDDTFLNKLYLLPGKNLIRASHGNVGEELSVICRYNSNYREGIY